MELNVTFDRYLFYFVGMCLLSVSPVSAQVQTPTYCLACIEPDEGKPGAASSSRNPGNGLDLFFLDSSANLVTSATRLVPGFQGNRLGMVSCLANGILFGRAGAREQASLLMNRSLAQQTIAGLFAHPRSLRADLQGAWQRLSAGPKYEKAIVSAVERHGLARDWRLGGYYPYLLETGQARDAVSPNGDKICLVLSLVAQKGLGPLATDPLAYDVLIVRLFDRADTDVLAIGTDARWKILGLSWSPDGNSVAFYRVPAVVYQEAADKGDERIRVADGWQPCVLDLRSSQIRTYEPKATTIFGGVPPARWSPDQQRLLVSLSYDDPSSPSRFPSKGIFLVDRRSGAYDRLSTPPSRDEALSWAPTGDRYLFLSLPPVGRHSPWLYGVGQINSPERPIVLDATGRDVRDVVWSPDGKYLAYASAPKEDDGWVDRITVIEASGEGKPREIARSAPHPQSLTRRYYNLTWLNLPAK